MSGVRWPPSYDESYRPPTDQPYWFPQLETLPTAERERLIVKKLQAALAHAYAHAPFYRRKWDRAGIRVSDIQSLTDFAALPVTTKAELRAAQAETAPFGDYLCIPESEIFHIHGTSGTTGRPTAFAVGRDDWRRVANAHARIMWGMGYQTVGYGLYRLAFQPLCRVVGRACRRRTTRSARVPVRRRGAGSNTYGGALATRYAS